MALLTGDIMPQTSDNRPAFTDAPAVARRLVRAVAGMLGVVSLALTAAVVLGGRRDWQAALLPSLAITLLAAFVSLPALAWGLFGTYYRAVGGCLVGMVLRGLVTASGLLVVVVVWHRSPLAMLLLVTPLYFAQLAAECIVLVRALRTNG